MQTTSAGCAVFAGDTLQSRGQAETQSVSARRQEAMAQAEAEGAEHAPDAPDAYPTRYEQVLVGNVSISTSMQFRS